jgi:hypothetical protein
MTSSSWAAKACSNGSSGPDATAGSLSGGRDAAATLRTWLTCSRGKGLLELIEAMGGKPVKVRVMGWPSARTPRCRN